MVFESQFLVEGFIIRGFRRGIVGRVCLVFTQDVRNGVCDFCLKFRFTFVYQSVVGLLPDFNAVIGLFEVICQISYSLWHTAEWTSALLFCNLFISFNFPHFVYSVRTTLLNYVIEEHLKGIESLIADRTYKCIIIGVFLLFLSD